MCICIDCSLVDRCQTYFAVETQHQQPHLNEYPDFDPIEPSININIRTSGDLIDMEWDVVGCLSFLRESGKWSKLKPGQAVPT
jgi:hypothetical protein